MEEFNKSRIMELPRSVVIGHNAIQSIGSVAKKLHLEGRALIVADQNTIRIAGERAESLLREAGYEVETALIEDAKMEIVEGINTLITKKKVSFVLGVGGGRPIDVAKYSSHNAGIPFISVPTAASHDGIVSSTVSISINGRNRSIRTHSPLAVVADTTIIASSPHKLLAAGCGDIVANYTAVRDWRLARLMRNEYYSSYAAALSEMTATMLVENSVAIRPGLEESAWLVMKALVSSGVAMSIAGSSRPASGSEHKFSHALDIIAPGRALHGEQCGVGSIMMMYLHNGDWKMIREALANVGAPTNAKELGVDEEDIIEALAMAHTIRPERYTILGDKGLTRDAAEQLAKETKVIL